MFAYRGLALLSLGLMITAIGCGGGGTNPGIVPAKGIVTLDGAAANGVTVTFVPQEGVSGRGGIATTDAEGRFSARSGHDEGILPGEYRVVFEQNVLADGTPVPPDVALVEVDAKNLLPEIYADPVRSPIVVTVESSGSENLVFDLLSKPR